MLLFSFTNLPDFEARSKPLFQEVKGSMYDNLIQRLMQYIGKYDESVKEYTSERFSLFNEILPVSGKGKWITSRLDICSMANIRIRYVVR